MFKYPANSALLAEARLYAKESIEHTVDYKGWADGHKKLSRIVTGKYAQIWLAEFCALNDIDFKKDNSSPYESDDCDIEICGYKIDCKASVSSNFLYQVSPHIEKQNQIFAYAFFLTDEKCSFIKPCGFIRRDRYLKHAIKIEKGQFLPNTKVVQKFDKGSYFLDKEYVKPFEDAIDFFIKRSELKAA